MNLGLQNKHALVTGASGGIGYEIVRGFLAEGAKVTATYLTHDQQLSALSAEGDLYATRADISKESDVKALFHGAVKKFGRVDIAVANAGIANHEGIAIHEMSLEQWNRTLSVNLTGAFLTAKYFFANLCENPGKDASLVLIGSTAGVFGEAWYCDYSTSKAGMYGLLRSLKNEIVHLAERGRVNLVNPGWTRTPMAKEALSDPYMLTKVFHTLPLRKVATPQDIASAVLFLSSDAVAGHISGEALTISGGMEGRVLYSPDELQEYVNREIE